MRELKTSKPLEIRFSEVDVMNVVWHGSYALYFEDAREAFGEEYDLSYMGFIAHGYFAPLVELDIKYKQPLRHGRHYRTDIIYRTTEAAKIVFDYEIYDTETGQLMSTAHSVQVFMDLNYQLVWDNPEFYREWKERWGVKEGK